MMCDQVEAEHGMTQHGPFLWPRIAKPIDKPIKCACGKPAHNPVGWVTLTKENRRSPQRWVCDECFVREFGTQ